MQVVSCMIRITGDTLLFFPFVSKMIRIIFDTTDFFNGRCNNYEP